MSNPDKENTSIAPTYFDRLIERWKETGKFLFAMLRPELTNHELPVPGLFFLYEDCYHTMLIGRFNAAIVLMGVLLEALMKERIRLKLGSDFRGAYGACLIKIQNKQLMEPEDLFFLRQFKDKIRNPYSHFDELQIVNGSFVPAWELKIDEMLPGKFEETLKSIKSGERKPFLARGSHPALRSIVKQEIDRKRAIQLFNKVYDFLCYFRERKSIFSIVHVH